MFCSNCGSKNPDDARFCGNCGAAISAPTKQAQVNKPASSNKPTTASGGKKKGGGLFLTLFMIFLIGLAVDYIQSSDSKPSQSRADSPQIEITATVPPAVVPVDPTADFSAAYCDFFESRGLDVPKTSFFYTSNQVSAYAGELDAGVLEDMEFEHKAGIVTAMVDTVYIPVEGLDDSAKDLIHSTMMESLSAYDQMDCCNLSYFKGNSYYVYRLEVSDMDDVDTVRMITSAGVISVTNGSELIGIEATEEGLLASGYVER